jgi:hypothetical protein
MCSSARIKGISPKTDMIKVQTMTMGMYGRVRPPGLLLLKFLVLYNTFIP